MRYKARWISPDDFKDLYSLFLRNDFPHTPKTYREAHPCIATTDTLGVYFGKCLVGALVAIPADGVVYIDACADKHFRNRWPRTIVRQFFKSLTDYNLLVIRTEKPTVKKMALKMGFEPRDDNTLTCKPSKLRIVNGRSI